MIDNIGEECYVIMETNCWLVYEMRNNEILSYSALNTESGIYWLPLALGITTCLSRSGKAWYFMRELNRDGLFSEVRLIRLRRIWGIDNQIQLSERTILERRCDRRCWTFWAPNGSVNTNRRLRLDVKAALKVDTDRERGSWWSAWARSALTHLVVKLN